MHRRTPVSTSVHRERPALYLYDDAVARRFEPFALTRPVSTMVAGALPIWSRWQVAMQAPLGGLCCGRILANYRDFDTPPAATGTISAGMIVANSRFVPAGDVVPWRGFRGMAPAGKRSLDADASAWTNDDRVVAVRLAADLDASAFESGALALESLVADGPTAPMSGWWHDEVWDFIRYLSDQLTNDILRALVEPPEVSLRSRVATWTPPAHSISLGTHPIIVHGQDTRSAAIRPAEIEPHVVFDATAGPIYVASGAHIRAFTRLVGPCYIGNGTTIVGGDVSGCSIGPRSKIRGEISASIVLGYSNKGHEGFVGHSYLGRWVNLGAGTTTSNLKNTYGSVSLWTPEGIRDTGLQFLGTLFGDHVKTGIGLRLTTGTVLGAGANVYGSAMPPKAVPPFAWGDGLPYGTYEIGKFLEAAERMMARREVSLTDQGKRLFSLAHEARWTP